MASFHRFVRMGGRFAGRLGSSFPNTFTAFVPIALASSNSDNENSDVDITLRSFIGYGQYYDRLKNRFIEEIQQFAQKQKNEEDEQKAMILIDDDSANTSFESFGGNQLSLKVPLAVGTLQWGTTWIDHHILNHKGCITQNNAQNIVNTFSNHGVTLWDTAEGYGGGTSERRLGNTTTTCNKNIIYMTKFLPVPWRYSHKSIENAIRGSCKRLNIECIDIYLLHSPVHWRSIEFWVEGCAKCKRLGLIKTMGLSNCSADQVKRAVAAGKKYGIDVVCNQIHYSLLTFNSVELHKMEEICRKLNVTLIGFSPIGQGVLTDKLTKNNLSTNRTAKMLHLKWNDLEDLREILKELADKYNKSMAQIAINWSICHKVVPLIGCRSVKQAKDSLGGAVGWTLDKKDVQRLDELALAKSTLESPKYRRVIFVTLFGIIMIICRMLDYFGYGIVEQAR